MGFAEQLRSQKQYSLAGMLRGKEPTSPTSLLKESEKPKPVFNTDGLVFSASSTPTVQEPEPTTEKEKKGVFRWIGDNLMAGLGGSNKAFYGALESIGGDKIPGVKNVLKFGKEVAERDISKGGTDLGSQAVQAIPGAATNLGLALMSGGASVPAQLGQSATQQAAQAALRSPTFYNSLLHSYGGAYNEAREAGEDRGSAITSALLEAIPTAAIEQTGGIEQLPAKAAKQGLLKTIGKTALEEAGEELLQYPIGGAVRKATYAPETPVFSTTEDAIINPVEMGKGAVIGGVMGGLMGGVGKLVSGRSSVNVTEEQTNDFTPVEQETKTEQATVKPVERNRHAELEVALNENVDEVVRLYKQQAQTELRAAQDAYNSAIEEIQNEYMTNQLRTDEAEAAIQKYGLNDLVAKIEEAETKLQKIPEQIKAEMRFGLGTEQQYDLLEQQRKPISGQSEQQPIGGDISAEIAPIGGKPTESTTDTLPDTEQELSTMIDEMARQQKQGVAINLQQFAAAQQKLRNIRERGFSRNTRTDANNPDNLRQSFTDNPLMYEQLANKSVIAKAQAIFDKGVATAHSEFYRSVMKGEYRPEMVVLSKMLARHYSSNGDVDTARNIISDVAEILTEAGQFTQVAKLLREADPETFLMTVDKQLKKLNEQGQQRYGKKWTDVDLTAEEKAAIQQIQPGDQETYDSTMEQIRNRLANEMPTDAMEKFDAWRRMAMLLNPKTHIRNVGGNVIMMGMRKTADTIGAGLEVLTDEIRKAAGMESMERTKSVGWSLDKNRAETVNKSWETVKKDLEGTSRWKSDIVSALGKEKRTFKSDFLQWLNDTSFNTLNFEDNVFTERAYKDALGQYLKSNNTTEVTDRAVEYATRRALEATYRQHNKVADAINKLKRTRGAGKLVEAAIPFTKTPMNIAKTAFEYSPLGLTKAFFQSDKSPVAIIESVSKGMTGIGIFGLGTLLRSIGWAKGGKKRSEKSEALEQVSGIQQYSLTTPKGSFTLDWAQPFAIPFFMGVSLMEKLEQTEDFDYDSFMDAAAAGGDTFFNMTMLQNVKRILGGAGSSTEAILGLPWNYVQQAWPSIFGQSARTIDDTRRSTYDQNGLKQIWNTVKAKIPFASKDLEPALDVWGQEQNQGGLIQQFISPGYWKDASDDEVTQEIARLHESFSDNDMLPKVAPKSFSANKVKYTLTTEQHTEFQREMGQENYYDIARLISSSEYNRMSDEQKVKKIKKIVSDNYDDAKENIIKASALKGN